MNNTNDYKFLNIINYSDGKVYSIQLTSTYLNLSQKLNNIKIKV